MRRIWTAAEVDCLLNHMEIHKGPDGQWAKNHNRAAEAVMSELEAVKFPGARSLSTEHIRGKIRTITQNVPGRDRQKLYEQGPAALELREKLGIEPRRTRSDVAAELPQATENLDTQGFEPNEHDEDDDTDNAVLVAVLDTPTTRQAKSSNAPKTKPRTSDACSIPTTQAPNPASERSHWDPRSRHVATACSTEVSDGFVPTAVAETLTGQCPSRTPKTVDLSLQRFPNVEERTRQTFTEQAWEMQILEVFRKAFSVVGHVDARGHADVGIGMANTYRHITDAIGNLHQLGDRRTIQYFPLLADEVFLELGPFLFPGRQPAELIQNLSTVHGVHGVAFKDILISFAAVALTRWPQKVFRGYREQWEASDQGRFGRSMLHDAPAFHLKYSRLIYVEYITEEVSDNLPFQSWDLFTKFQAMLDNLVCGTRRPVEDSDPRYEPGVSERSRWRAREMAHDSFRKSLTSLFSQRLRQHLEFEKSALWYGYICPRMKDLFDPMTMRTEPDRPVTHCSQVRLCMFPGILSQEKSESGDGGRGEPAIISKALVTLL